MDLKRTAIVLLATSVALSAAPIDQKTSHGPFTLGQSISSLDKSRFASDGTSIVSTQDGREITLENFKFNTSGLGLVFGNMPISSAHITTLAGKIVTINLLLDSDQMNPLTKWKISSERRHLLALALIDKYGKPTETKAADPSDPPTEFYWKGDDGSLAYYLTSPSFNDDGALVVLESKRIAEKATAAFFKEKQSFI